MAPSPRGRGLQGVVNNVPSKLRQNGIHVLMQLIPIPPQINLGCQPETFEER